MPKQQYIIKFSADNISTEGKKLSDAIKDEYDRLMSQLSINKISKTQAEKDELMNLVKKNTMSKREAEKIILDTYLIVAANKTNKLGEHNMIANLASVIKNSDAFVIIDSDDIDSIKKGFEKIEEKDKKDWWIKCIELYLQLENPEKYEEKKSDSDKEIKLPEPIK